MVVDRAWCVCGDGSGGGGHDGGVMVVMVGKVDCVIQLTSDASNGRHSRTKGETHGLQEAADHRRSA
jgi:hypothetical protein